MAKLITDPTRKAIKKMAQISQCVRALSLMPTAEDFAMRLIGDMRNIARMINNVSTRINDILDRYSSIPGEFLLKGFDEILDRLDDINDYAKFAIKETSDVMSTTVKSAQEMTSALGSAVSATTSAALQIGGGLSYGTIAMGANIKLAMTGNGKRSIANSVVEDTIDGKVSLTGMDAEIKNRIKNEVGTMDDLANSIRDWTQNSATNSSESISSFFENAGSGIDGAVNWIDDKKNAADAVVDDTVGALMEKVENAKKEVESKIERVREVFSNFVKQFDDAFGFVNGKNFAEDALRKASDTAYNQMDSPVFDAVGEVTGEIADFIQNFSIGKVVTAIGGIVVGAGAATLAMDLLPSIDVDRMLKDIIGGVDTYRMDKLTELNYNKYYETEPDLWDIPDVPWRLSKDDIEKYNAAGYEKYLEEFVEENDKKRTEILEKMQSVQTSGDLAAVTEENKEKMKENKSALKAMRKVRRDAIKAKQIEKYKGFLSIELNYLKKECQNMKTNIKNEWDSMMRQYKTAIEEIKRFFSKEGCGGCEVVDRCCDRINDDADQIVELCKNITVELTSVVIMVPTPYAIGTCVDMPVHKIVSFFKDIKIILTFLKNLIRLGIDIISQLTILAKLIFNGIQSLAEILQTLKELIGVDSILSMIDYIVALFRPTVVDSKILLENAISPVYYNETEDYERRVKDIEALFEDETIDDYNGIEIEKFTYTDDPYAKKKYRRDKYKYGGTANGCKDDDGENLDAEGEIEEWLEKLEEKREREIVAYRSPILNDEGDDFAGWIFFHAHAYDSMKKGWRDAKKRRRDKVIKKASKKNKMRAGKLVGGIAQLKTNMSFGYTEGNKFHKNTVSGYDAYYWYTKWTDDPMDCEPDFSNVEFEYDGDGMPIAAKVFEENVVSPVFTTANGSLVELNDGRRIFVEGRIVSSGDFVSVNGVKYKVK
jgi:gas vesicle protein